MPLNLDAQNREIWPACMRGVIGSDTLDSGGAQGWMADRVTGRLRSVPCRLRPVPCRSRSALYDSPGSGRRRQIRGRL